MQSTQTVGEAAASSDAAAGAGVGPGAAADRQRSPFAPLALGLAALVAWTGFQTVQLVRDHLTLAAAFANQQPQVEQSERLRNQLSSLATGLARLGDQGNQNARLIVDELRKRGVTINPNGPAVAGPAPAR